MAFSGRMIVYDEVFRDICVEVENHLDLGCDRGDITFEVWKLLGKPRTVGADINEEAIADAEEKYMGCQNDGLTFSSLNELTEAGSYDIITALEVLEHVNERESFLKLVSSKMGPHSLFILSVPHKGLFDVLDPFNFRFVFPQKVFKVLYRLVKRSNPNFDDRPKHHHFTINELSEILKKANLKIISYQRSGLLFFYIKWLFSDILDSRFKDNVLYKVFWNLLNMLANVEMKRSFGRFSSCVLIIAKKAVP